MPSLLDPILNSPMLSRIRRNHALEHATIHLLTTKGAKKTLIGRADSDGFYLYGDVPTERVEQASAKALERLRAGERHLAVHPNCGTSLITAGFLASSTAFFTILGVRRSDDWRDRLSRLPFAILATTLALIAAQPLGAAAQRHLTTEGNPGDLEITAIRRFRSGNRTFHRVLTSG